MGVYIPSTGSTRQSDFSRTVDKMKRIERIRREKSAHLTYYIHIYPPSHDPLFLSRSLILQNLDHLRIHPTYFLKLSLKVPRLSFQTVAYLRQSCQWPSTRTVALDARHTREL